MGFDLSKIETRKRAEEGVDFAIVDAAKNPVLDADGKPLTIRMGGADSVRIKNVVRDRQRRRRAEVEAAAAAGLPEPEYTWEVREDEVVEDLVALTLGWSDNIELDGAPYPFSKENAEKLYRRFPELAEQMTAKASVRVNFMPTSPKS
jgi:hypothetical protein